MNPDLNLKDERLMILEMVRAGELNTDDAIKLMSAIQGGTATTASSATQDENFEQKAKNFYDHVDTFTQDLKNKLGHAYDTGKPKIKHATQKTLEKTATALDKLSEKLETKLNDVDNGEE